jgi:hypothetical protein
MTPEVPVRYSDLERRFGTSSFPFHPRAHVVGCRWFCVWAVLGCAAAFGVVSFVGVLLLPPVLLAGGFMASRPTIRRSAFGLLSGAGVLLLYVAWLQRAGPGTTCWQRGTSSGCEQHLNPLPWLIAGLALFACGVVGHARQG